MGIISSKVYKDSTRARDNKLLRGVNVTLQGVIRELSMIAQSSFTGNMKFIELVPLTPPEIQAAFKAKRLNYDSVENSVIWAMLKVELTNSDGTKDLIQHPITLPFFEKAGTTVIRGNHLWRGCFVLPDKIFSQRSTGITTGSIFLRFIKNKTSIRSMKTIMDVKEHDSFTSKLCMISNTGFIRKPPTNPSPLRPKATPMSYLLAKFGYTWVMNEMLGYVPLAIPRDQVKDYMDPRYIVIMPPGRIPRARKTKTVKKADIAFVIDTKTIEVNKDLLYTVMGYITYQFDVFPDTTIDKLDNTSYWVYSLAQASYGSGTVAHHLSNIRSHIRDKEAEVDELQKQYIWAEFGFDLPHISLENGFYDVLMLLMEKMQSWLSCSREVTTTGFDKGLNIYYYLLYDYIVGFNKANQDIQRKMDLLTNNIPLATVAAKFSLNIPWEIGMRCYRNSAVLNVVESTSPCYALKHTSRVKLQINDASSAVSKKKQSHGPTASDPTTMLDPSHAVCGTVSSISKGAPAPLSHLNMYCPLTRSGTYMNKYPEDLEKITDILKNHGLKPFNTLPPEFRYRMK